MRLEELKLCKKRKTSFIILVGLTADKYIEEVTFMNDDSSLSHTRWNCKYHIIFVPKYRRKVIYGKLRAEIGPILRQLCMYKNVEIIEALAMKDYIHMLVKIPPKVSVSSFMGYVKGKSSLMIFERYANLKYKFGNSVFWSKGYYVSTVGLDTKTVEENIYEIKKKKTK